jgi:hypothetical protein
MVLACSSLKLSSEAGISGPEDFAMRAPPTPPPEPPSTLDQAQLEALRQVPAGAAALSSVAVLLLLAAWLLIYFLIYRPRGMIG